MAVECVGLIGDIHAEAGYLELALRFFQGLQVESILCVGDIADGLGDIDRCCDLLDQAKVITVRGNHDRWLLEGTMRDGKEATQWADISEASQVFLRSLPKTQAIETVAGRLLLCHGLGENDMQRLTPDDYGYALQSNHELQALIHRQAYRFVVNGHTHRPMVRQFQGLTVINAGTLYYNHDPCIAIANFRDECVQFYGFHEGVLGPNGPPISVTVDPGKPHETGHQSEKSEPQYFNLLGRLKQGLVNIISI